MIKGPRIVLRTIREGDVDALYALRSDVSLRGEHLRPSLMSQPAFRKEFQDTGFMAPERGMLLITGQDGRLLGDIGFFGVNYMDGLEIGYTMYDLPSRRQGLMTEALALTVRFLFDTRKINRLQICTGPGNEASQRLALRCGFTFEARLRGHMYHHGRNEDTLVYALLREDWVPPAAAVS